MNRSSDALAGAVWSYMKLQKREDGQYEAVFPNNPEVPAGVANSESQAVENAKQNFRDLDSKGKIGK